MAYGDPTDEQYQRMLKRQSRRLGTREPRCTECGATDPPALTGSHPDIVCYECQNLAAGRSLSEDHHIAGRHNDPTTAPFPGNWHRLLNDMQKMWPTETL